MPKELQLKYRRYLLSPQAFFANGDSNAHICRSRASAQTVRLGGIAGEREKACGCELPELAASTRPRNH